MGQQRRWQSFASVRMVKDGAVLNVTVRGVLTEGPMRTLQAEATEAMRDLRACACLIDLADCVVEFRPSILAQGFIAPSGSRPDDRPCALVVSSRWLNEFNLVAREAAFSGVLMPIFTSREPARRFLEAQAALWWTDRRYPGSRPVEPSLATLPHRRPGAHSDQ